MTKEQIDSFRAGYTECRWITIFEIKKILTHKTGIRRLLLSFINELEEDECREAWESAQEEFPGITEEQYQESLRETSRLTSEMHHSQIRRKNIRLLK